MKKLKYERDNITEPDRDHNKDGILGEYKETHPSYGLLQISRVSGRQDSLFGSSLQHSNFITLRINKGSRYHDKFGDNYFEDGNYMEVEMSNVQFAEAITSLNVGSGVPCTIRYSNQGDLEPGYQPSAVIDNQKKRLLNDSANRLKETAQKLQEMSDGVDEILNKNGAIGKGDRKALHNMMGLFIQEIGGNLPFLQQQMSKSIDKTVVQAKGEIESFITNAVINTGLEALRKQVDASKALDYNPTEIKEIE